MGSWRLPASVVKQSLYYSPEGEVKPLQGEATEDGGVDGEEETSLMDAIPIGEAIHGGRGGKIWQHASGINTYS